MKFFNSKLQTMSLLESTSKEKEFGHQTAYLLVITAILLIFIENLMQSTNLVQSIENDKLRWLFSFLSLQFDKFQQLSFNLNFFTTHSILLALYVFIILISPNKPKPKVSKLKANSYLLLGIVFWLFPFLLSFSSWLGYFFQVVLDLLSMLFIVKGGLLFNSIVLLPENDLFNERNEQFPQNEQLLENEFSIGFKTQYLFKNKWKEGIIPIINPQRGVLVAGSQGSGKTYSVLIPALWQSLYKGYCGVIYDFKFPDMSIEAFNATQKALKNDAKVFTNQKQIQPILPEFIVIDFEHLKYSNRCNPFQHLTTIDDAAQLAKILLVNLNKSWIRKEGDFWITSAVNYLTCTLWYLKLMEKEYPELGSLCDLPHAIELINKDPQEVFNCIEHYAELTTYSSMFILALRNKADTQLTGQIATIQSALARLSSPNIYWVMSGNEIELKVNDPKAPKIICLGNTPIKSSVYGAALSVYMATLMKNVYEFKSIKCAFFIDELPSMYLQGLDEFVATIRSYKVATWLGIQDIEQLVKSYGQEAANVIINTCGTLFSGAVNAKSAETFSKMFGKTNQNKVDTSLNKNDLNLSYINQLQEVVPASKIATLSQGFFVGKVADTFEQPIALKLFKSFIHVEKNELKKEFTELPLRFKGTELELQSKVQENYQKIKSDIQKLLAYETQKLL